MKQLYIIRGIPGSGKSTLAHKLMAAHLLDGPVAHCKADQYFTNRRGEYLYDKSKVQDAHWFCVKKAEEAMKDGIPTIIVSNTFTQEWQIAPYRKLAVDFLYSAQELVCLGAFGSVHNIPPETIKKMGDRLIADLDHRYGPREQEGMMSESLEQRALRIAHNLFGSHYPNHMYIEFARRLMAEQGEPIAWVDSIEWSKFQTETVKKLTKNRQSEHGFNVPLYAKKSYIS